MVERAGYDPARLEAAVGAATRKEKLNQASVAATMASTHLPPVAATYGLFARNFGAFVGNVMGLIGELEAAVSVDTTQISGEVELSKEYPVHLAPGHQDVDLNLTVDATARGSAEQITRSAGVIRASVRAVTHRR